MKQAYDNVHIVSLKMLFATYKKRIQQSGTPEIRAIVRKIIKLTTISNGAVTKDSSVFVCLDL